jgi:4-diphosphocytidyl-2C-methyl-D-erythritol kinase
VSGAAGPLLETNDFESVVFREHPGLNTIKTKLKKAGAARAMMTGSGSAIYGLFDTREKLDAARARLAGERLCPFAFVSRSRYQQQWRRLGGRLVGEEIWR